MDLILIRNHFIFPVAYASNLFATTGFLIFLGLAGELDMAADVGIAQSAILVVFMAFSTNARNLLLSDTNKYSVATLVCFRLCLVVPLSLLAWFLSTSFIDIEVMLLVFLLMRKITEWFAELHITHEETKNNTYFAQAYIFLQGIAFVSILFALLFFTTKELIYALAFWSISPLILTLNIAVRNIPNINFEKNDFVQLLPHLGSSWIIAVSTYVFRILLVLIVGKSFAGLLFSAYAIGGVINSFYTYALGPSIARKITEYNRHKEVLITIKIFAVVVLAGLCVLLISLTYDFTDGINKLYLSTIGFSIIGSAIMLLAQRQRIFLLQKDDENVFVPDVIINIIVISSVPFAFYLFGHKVLAVIFLWSSIVSFFFYSIPFMNIFIFEKLPERLLGFAFVLNREKIQFIAVLSIITPIFFQLGDVGIFNESIMNFDHQGSIKLLPLPLSVIGCFCGLMFLAKYSRCVTSSVVIFGFFVLMLVSIFAVDYGDRATDLSRMILMIQFILPWFGLFLGHSYTEPNEKKYSLEAITLFMLLAIVPLQIISTILQGTIILTPYLYLFSIYQHLQYVPVILVSLFILVAFSLYKDSSLKWFVFFLPPIMLVYAILSFSMTAVCLVLLCLTIFITSRLYYKKYKTFIVFVAMVAVAVIVAYSALMTDIFSKRQNDTAIVLQILPEKISIVDKLEQRIHYWSIYWSEINQSSTSFLLGSQFQKPQDGLTSAHQDGLTSAHNYYLDLVYHFGFISLVPFLCLLFYTGKLLFYSQNAAHDDLSIVSLGLVLFFILFLDNSFNVGLRQPYSGILTFFLWGVFIQRLRHTVKKSVIKHT